MKYCIIDDEPIAHRIIEGYCAHLPNLKKIGNCYDAFEAMELLRKQQVDVIFLDINMPKLSGFDFLKTLSTSPNVIVTSAYQEFALEGYELNITDYLLKPFSLERFLKAINKVLTFDQSSKVEIQGVENTSFFLKGDKKIHQIHKEAILFVEAYGNYIKVYRIGDMIIAHQKISSMEDLLSPPQFLRVHKSFIIATAKIDLIEGNRIKIGDHQIPVGQTYKHNLKNLLK